MKNIGYEERAKVYDRAIRYYGANEQTIVAIEEMSEVIKALTKHLRSHYPGRLITNEGEIAISNSLASIIEEVADATIMLEQLRLIYEINEEVGAAMDAKIERLKERIGYNDQSREA